MRQDSLTERSRWIRKSYGSSFKSSLGSSCLRMVAHIVQLLSRYRQSYPMPCPSRILSPPRHQERFSGHFCRKGSVGDSSALFSARQIMSSRPPSPRPILAARPNRIIFLISRFFPVSSRPSSVLRILFRFITRLLCRGRPEPDFRSMAASGDITTGKHVIESDCIIGSNHEVSVKSMRNRDEISVPPHSLNKAAILSFQIFDQSKDYLFESVIHMFVPKLLELGCRNMACYVALCRSLSIFVAFCRFITSFFLATLSSRRQ